MSVLCKLNEVDPPTSQVLNHTASQTWALKENAALPRALGRSWKRKCLLGSGVSWSGQVGRCTALGSGGDGGVRERASNMGSGYKFS